MNWTLIGPPGSGKGTVSSILSNKGYFHFSLGDYLRLVSKENTSLGKAIKESIDKGQLIGDDLAVSLTLLVLRQFESSQICLIDGIPRTIEQAHLLEAQIPIEGALYFEIHSHLLLERLSGRRVCSNCKTVYHISNHPPRLEGVCDVCQSTDIVQREDDKPEVVAERLKVYEEKTAPLKEFYESTGRLVRIDAEKTPVEVAAQIEQLIQAFSTN